MEILEKQILILKRYVMRGKMGIKDFWILIEVMITVAVSTLVLPVCEYINKEKGWNNTLIILIISLLLVALLFIAKKIINNREEYGKFQKFVDKLDNNYKSVETSFNKVGKDYEKIHKYIDLHMESRDKVENLINEVNRKKFDNICNKLEETQDLTTSKIFKFSSDFRMKVRNKNREDFDKELDNLHVFFRDKIHAIAVYIEEEATNINGKKNAS